MNFPLTIIKKLEKVNQFICEKLEHIFSPSKKTVIQFISEILYLIFTTNKYTSLFMVFLFAACLLLLFQLLFSSYYRHLLLLCLPSTLSARCHKILTL